MADYRGNRSRNLWITANLKRKNLWITAKYLIFSLIFSYLFASLFYGVAVSLADFISRRKTAFTTTFILPSYFPTTEKCGRKKTSFTCPFTSRCFWIHKGNQGWWSFSFVPNSARKKPTVLPAYSILHYSVIPNGYIVSTPKVHDLYSLFCKSLQTRLNT